MPTEMTIKASIIELNRLKSQERMDIDRERLNAAIDKLTEAGRFRIKRHPNAEGDDDMDCYLCPHCGKPVGTVYNLYGENMLNRFCNKCGQALDWSD